MSAPAWTNCWASGVCCGFGQVCVSVPQFKIHDQGVGGFPGRLDGRDELGRIDGRSQAWLSGCGRPRTVAKVVGSKTCVAAKTAMRCPLIVVRYGVKATVCVLSQTDQGEVGLAGPS